MAFSATTYDRELNLKPDCEIINVLAGTGAVFCKGDIVTTKVGTGLAWPLYSDGATGDVILGVSLEGKTAAAGESVMIQVTGEVDFDIATTAQADAMGRVVYGDHDAAGSGNPYTVIIAAPAAHPNTVGVVVGLNSTTSVRVRLTTPSIPAV